MTSVPALVPALPTPVTGTSVSGNTGVAHRNPEFARIIAAEGVRHTRMLFDTSRPGSRCAGGAGNVCAEALAPQCGNASPATSRRGRAYCRRARGAPCCSFADRNGLITRPRAPFDLSIDCPPAAILCERMFTSISAWWEIQRGWSIAFRASQSTSAHSARRWECRTADA